MFSKTLFVLHLKQKLLLTLFDKAIRLLIENTYDIIKIEKLVDDNMIRFFLIILMYIL